MENPKEHKQEIVGYRLKSSIDRMMVDGILKNAMPIWNKEDKSVYFIRGHIAGSLVAKMKELQVLDLWFTPIYELEEVKSDWVKQNHLDSYYKEGMMKESKQETTLEEVAQWVINNRYAKSELEKVSDFEMYHTIINKCSKWMQETMYSEEDMEKAFIAGSNSMIEEDDDYGSEFEKYMKEWFENYKKK